MRTRNARCTCRWPVPFYLGFAVGCLPFARWEKWMGFPRPSVIAMKTLGAFYHRWKICKCGVNIAAGRKIIGWRWLKFLVSVCTAIEKEPSRWIVACDSWLRKCKRHFKVGLTSFRRLQIHLLEMWKAASPWRSGSYMPLLRSCFICFMGSDLPQRTKQTGASLQVSCSFHTLGMFFASCDSCHSLKDREVWLSRFGISLQDRVCTMFPNGPEARQST